MNIEIRVAKPGDAVAACDVLRRSIAACCIEDHHNDAGILAAWLGNKTPETIAGWFSSPANFSVIATAGNEVIGVALLTRAGKISLCHLIPEARFTGAGKALLQGLESQALEWGLPLLKVNSTITAEPFYLRHGFIGGGPGKAVCGIDTILLWKRIGIDASAETDAKSGACGYCFKR